MTRRFVTKTDIDDLADRGELLLRVEDRTTITDLAREHAQQRGVRIVRASVGDAGPQGDAVPTPASVAEPGPEELRSAVRSAVLARLGQVPAGLDAAIDRAIGPRR